VPETQAARWLVLFHQIPPTPSYLRVKVGRRLQGLGAVAVKNSVYVLPRTDEALEDFQWVRREIVAGGGEASVCEARFVEGLSDPAIEGLFNAAREADYAALAREARALQAAAIQQQLMVAAFTCNDVSLYNRFVMSYQKELQASDEALKAYFVRLDGPGGGMAGYHAFKTRLANQSSINSIHDTGGYCATADAAYDAALNHGRASLAEFLSAQPFSVELSSSACREEVNGEPVTPRDHTAMASAPGQQSMR